MRGDIPPVLQIERDSYADPWSEKDLLRSLNRENALGFVAFYGERLAGYAILQIAPTKPGKLVNIAVSPSKRRLGIGTQLVGRVLEESTTLQMPRLSLTLRETSLEAQLFFRAQQFKAVEILRNFFSETGEDGYVMTRELKHENDRPDLT